MDYTVVVTYSNLSANTDGAAYPVASGAKSVECVFRLGKRLATFGLSATCLLWLVSGLANTWTCFAFEFLIDDIFGKGFLAQEGLFLMVETRNNNLVP